MGQGTVLWPIFVYIVDVNKILTRSFFYLYPINDLLKGSVIFILIFAQGLESNFNRFGVFVIPAIAYSVSDKVTQASHLGDGLYYNHTWMKDVARSNEFGFDLFHGISFGAYYFF